MKKTVDVAIIEGDEDYKEALARVNQIYGAEPGSNEFFELKFLAEQIEDFEEENFPIPNADPIEIIEFLLQQKGLRNKDLEGVIGTWVTVSYVLNRKTPLTIPMIINLSRYFKIRPDVLTRKYIYC